MLPYLRDAEVITFGVINPKENPANSETAQTDMGLDTEKNNNDITIARFAEIKNFLRNLGLRAGFKNIVDTNVERFIRDTMRQDRNLEKLRSNRAYIGTVVRTMLFTDRYARAINTRVTT
ncbi:MAG: hypothetical protein QXU18_16400 [Thermoplasmatales archaeon]